MFYFSTTVFEQVIAFCLCTQVSGRGCLPGSMAEREAAVVLVRLCSALNYVTHRDLIFYGNKKVM